MCKENIMQQSIMRM